MKYYVRNMTHFPKPKNNLEKAAQAIAAKYDGTITIGQQGIWQLKSIIDLELSKAIADNPRCIPFEVHDYDHDALEKGIMIGTCARLACYPIKQKLDSLGDLHLLVEPDNKEVRP